MALGNEKVIRQTYGRIRRTSWSDRPAYHHGLPEVVLGDHLPEVVLGE